MCYTAAENLPAGSYFEGAGVCCSLESPDCAVQVQNQVLAGCSADASEPSCLLCALHPQAGQFYFSYTTNATAEVFGDGTSIVSLYNSIDGWEFGVEMDVSAGEILQHDT